MTNDREPVGFLVLSASLRTDSLNTQLARLAADAIEAGGGSVDLASMREFDAPSFNADDESQQWAPRPGPASVPGTGSRAAQGPSWSPRRSTTARCRAFLKNLIDWVSRARPQPFNERHGLLLSASPSMGGGNRGLWALRVPLEHLGARVYPACSP